MKFVLLALLYSGVALAKIEEWSWLDQVSPNRKIQDTAFRSGREYHFFYNAQLSSGIAGSSKQHSANRIQALVNVAFKSQTHVLLRLEKVRVCKINREIPNPRKIMPFDAFEDVQIEQHLKQKLERPLKFSYTNGLVHDVVFDQQEDPWSANIKRGVLNLLQVNLQQQRRVDTAEETRLTNTRSSGSLENDKATFYRVMEATLEGECETIYTIQEQPTTRHSNAPILNVTKSINFEKCNKRPQIKYNFRFADVCPSCEQKYTSDEKFLQSSTVAKYNITGDKQAFLIEGARIDSEYVFTPFSEEANTIVTYVNQTLVLIKSGPAQSIQEPQNPVESDSDMIFSLDWDVAYEKFHMSGNEQMHRRLHDSQQGLNKVEQAKKLVQKIAGQQTKEQLDDEMLQQYVRLVQLMRMSTESELEQISNVREASTPEAEKKLRDIVPQALGSCGTKACTKFLIQKIRQGQVSPLRGSFSIKELVQNRLASEEIITELIQLAESEKTSESQQLKRSTWLTIGSLINSLCTDNEDQLALETKENTEKLCPRELKEKYVKTLFNRLRQATKWQDKVLMLKTIGNAGLDLSIFELEKIIRQQDQSYPTHVRFEAISALREMKDSVPKKIQRVLMPVIMNRREYPTIRSIASYILLQTQPERPILDQLAHNLVTEPSQQFGAFLYTQMHSYANSTNPCEQQLATNMQLALRHAKRFNTGIGYSKLAHLSMHSKEQKFGVDLDFDAIFSNVSVVPRHLGFAIHKNALGFWQRYLATVNLFNEGLEPLIRQYFDEEAGELFAEDGPWSEVLRRHPRSVHNKNEYQQELDDIFSKHLKIRTRDYQNEHESEPKAYLSAAFKGQVTSFFPITKELIQQLMQEAGLNMRQLEQKLRQGFPVDYTTITDLHDTQYKIPTSMGLPLSVHIKMPVAWSLKGKLQASVESRKSYKIHAQLKPNALAQILLKVEAWSPIVNTGVKIKTKAKLFVPIDARVEIDFSTRPVVVKAVVKPPSQKRDLLVLESRPITYTQEWQRYTRSLEDGVDEKTIMGEEQNRVSTFTKCVGKQTLGVELCARGQVHRTPGQSVKGTPFAPFSGPNKIVITSEPGQDVPEEIQIKLTGKTVQVSSSEMQKPQFSQFTQVEQVESESDSESSSSSGSQQQSQEQQRETQTQPRQSRAPSTRASFQKILTQYRNYETKKAYKTQVHMEMQAGSNRKLNLEVSHTFDLKQRYGQLQMKLKRERPEQWEACLESEMMFPSNPQFAAEVKEKKILANAELKWGRTCSSENYVRVTTRAERSTQQMDWEKRQSPYQEYKKCQNKAWCSPLAQEEFVEKIAHMLKYRLDVDYQNVPVSVQNATNGLYRALKHYFYWQTDVNQFVQNQPNKIRAEIVLDAQTKQRVNITVQTPKETVKMQDLPLSRPLGVMNQKQSVSEQLRDYMNEDEDHAECSVTGKTGWNRRSQVETFDGTKFSAPFSNCWVVLAKDCGSQEPKFVVMARKSQNANGNAELKEVKIVTRRHRIHLTPETDEYDSVKVNVNGRVVDPEQEREIVENGRAVAQIEKDQSSVRIELPQTGVEVEFDGYAINVKLSQYYRAQQCGLCGHFDLETADEFRNPDFSEERDLRQFYMNYLVKDGQCQPPQQLSEVCESEECDKADRSSSSSSSSSSSQQDSASNEISENPEYKTKVIEMDDQICFSTVPVPQCDEDESYPMGTKQQKKVPYVCIDQDSESAEEIERQARRGRREIASLKNRTPTFTRTEVVPERCQKYTRN